MKRRRYSMRQAEAKSAIRVKWQQHKLDALPVTMASSSSSSSAAAAPQSQSVLVPRLPDLTLPVATAAPNGIPALGRRHAIGSSVYVKRSNGEETVAYVKEYNVEKALYTVELEKLGSGKTKTCRDKDLRTANMVEGLLGPFRAALFASRSDDSDLNA